MTASGSRPKKPETKASQLMHPVRMRIVATLAGRELTPQQIGEYLPDIPRASLYRHLQTLCAAGVARVVRETPIRGTLEKVYTVEEHSATLSAEDMADETLEDHRRYFTAFVATLLAQFRAYTEHRSGHLPPGEFGYNTSPFYLTDEDAKKMANEVNAVLNKWQSLTPEKGRKRRLLTVIVMPDEDIAKDEG